MPHGFNADRLARVGRHFDQHYVAAGKLPGVQITVARGGATVLSQSYGHADVRRGKPVADDTIFRIYSMTKPLTSVALMMLVEEGLIALDDPVHQHIPAWRDLGVFLGGTHRTGFATRPPRTTMRVVDLMRHTAGLTYGFQVRTNVDAAYRAHKVGELEKHGTLAGMIDELAKLPLEFDPGTAWNYSVATDVCGWLVQTVSGEPFEAFLQRRVLDPLGMTDTGFHVPADKAHRLAACYNHTADGFALQDDPEISPYLAPPSFVSGGGGLVSTSADYLKFAHCLLRGGAPLIGRKTLALMGANHLPGGVDLPALSLSLFSEAAYAGVGFGLGFATTLDAHRTLLPGSNGDLFWGGAASTFFWADPSEDLAVIFMTQLIPSGSLPLRPRLRTLVYGALE